MGTIMSTSGVEVPHFIFLATETPLCDAWKLAIRKYFPEDGDEHFSVQQGYLQDIDANLLRNDCMVSPANSFGLMDGGYVDYSDHARLLDDGADMVCSYL